MRELIEAIPTAVYYLVTGIAIVAINVYETKSIKKQLNGFGAKYAKDKEEETERRIKHEVEVAILKERVNQKTKGEKI